MEEEFPTKKQVIYGITAVGGLGLLALAATRYHIAEPSENLIKTGFGLGQKLHVCRSTYAWPFQNVIRMKVSPFPVVVNLNGMSNERIPFKLPIVVTVGPNTEDNSAMMFYAEKLAQKHPDEVYQQVKAIIAGQVRIDAAAMGADELFHKRNEFKQQISDGVQESLKDLGLKVINANLEELTDMAEDPDQPGQPGPRYFAEQRKRSLANVHAEAVVQVALAQAKGDIGAKEQEAARRTQIARLEAEAQLQENSRQLEISRSQADLEIAKAEMHRQSAVASAQAEAAIEQKSFELQQEIQRQRASQETERLRADELTTKIVEAEKLIRETGGSTEAERMVAENQARMQLITVEAQAKATRLEAEAKLYAQQRQAEGIVQLGNADAQALLAKLEAEAQGKLAMLKAEALGLEQLVTAAGGPQEYLAQSMIKQETLPEIAKAQAIAVRDMKPVIWNQTSGAGQGIVQALANDLPPYFDGLKQITGLDVTGFLRNKINPSPNASPNQIN